MKNICPTHHFAYSGNVCPFCEKERIESLSARFVKSEKKYAVNKTIKKPVEVEKDVTEDDLQKLKAKFNKR